MKKVYLIFSLLLMFLGINTAYAGVTWGGSVTDPNTLSNGSKIIIHTSKATNDNYTFLSCLVDSLLYVSGTEDYLDPYVTFTMETASGKTVNGKQAYYLKNDYCGKYITYVFINATEAEGGSILDGGHLEMRLKFTDDASKAAPFIIMSQADGAPLFNYTGTDVPAENSMMIVSQCAEQSNKLIALNCNFSSPYIATYGDWASWWQVGIANVNDDYVTDLSSLFTKVQNLNYKGGTAPGCYDQTMVDAFTTARTEADQLLNGSGSSDIDNNQAKAVYEKLESAYLALITGSEVPVHEGYFRISSAYAAYVEQQGEKAIKTVYATNDGKMKWKDLDNEDATMVWQFIDRHDGTWLLYNVGTGQYANGRDAIAQSATYTLTNDSTDCGVEFISLGQSQFNIKPSSYDIHTGGHNNGAGTSGDIVGWDGGLGGASAWYVTNVDADQIPTFEAIGAQNKLNRTLELLYDEAYNKYQIGSSFSIDTVAADWLVTSADYEKDKMVAFSNADHNEWHPDAHDGAGITGLLDNDENTFWGSCWSDPQPDTTQYLQFKLNKAVSGFAVYLTKRANQPNQATQLTFYVTNDTTDTNSWIKAGTISGLPASTVGSTELTYQSNGIELDGQYQYVRVFWTTSTGFTHFTGFHFQEAELSKDCQNATLGEVATNLKKELSNAEALINSGKATQEAIDALQKAYDAYTAELADPTVLKAKMDSIQGVYDKAATPSMLASDGSTVVFTAGQPGVYSDANKATLKATMDEVQKYLDDTESTGAYTKADIQTNMDKLTTAFNTFKATAPALKVATTTEDGNWYYLSASQHYYDVTGTAQNTYGEGDALQIRKGTVYVKANLADPTSYVNNASINVTGNKTLDDLGVNTDMAKWRFVNMGDTAYAIQNKATGLYIGRKTGGNAGLSITPVGFTVSEIGYATFIFDGKLLNGESTSPIHVQTNGQVLVFWDNHDLGNGSCFDLQDTGEPATDTQTPTLNLEEVVKGKLYTKCYPVTISYVADNINTSAYPYQIATIDTEKKEMTLAQYGDEITAGMPFFYIGADAGLGVAETPASSDTTALIAQLVIDKVIAKNPLTVNGLVGNYYPTNVAKGFGVVNDEEGVQSIAATTEGQEIGWNSAYIDLSQVKNGEPGTITVPLTGDLETAIKDAIIDAQTGNVNVYSIDGILIKKNVKVSEATKGLAKGIYIVGKQKVAVK